ncbi:MAG TPA: DUF1707 domain-containing protein [Mycobacteriales bacterium]|nr:DUF1707 domain-containing protein [Mycobacteriales bacterium]
MPTDNPLTHDSFTGLRPVSDLTAPGQMRAGDADREAAAVRIRRAYVEASLTLEEFDARTAAAWAATTRAELATLTADLPAPTDPLPGPPPTFTVHPLPVLPMPARPSGISKGRRALHIITMIWLTLSMVNVAIWALVCIGNLSWIYPWWIWVLVPVGTALAVIRRFVNPRSG